MKKLYSNTLGECGLSNSCFRTSAFTFSLLLLSIFGFQNKIAAQSNIYESYAILNINSAVNQYYDLQATTDNPDFNGTDLGTFYSTNSLILNGAQNKIYKCNTDNITNGNFYYRIYKTTDPAPAFSSPQTIFFTSDDGSSGKCSTNEVDQTWDSHEAGINVLNGLTPGLYYLEIYTTADFTYSGGSGTHYANNSGNNYKATFTVAANCVNGVSVSPSSTTPVCEGSSGPSLTATISTISGAGAANISYEWYSNTANNYTTGTTISGTLLNTTTATNTNTYTAPTTIPGTVWYYCKVINSDPTCGGSYVTAPVEVVVNEKPSVTETHTNVACFGASTGAIDITATGGTGTYTYAWTGTGVNASEDQTGLAAGNYSVVVTDANGCSTASLPVTITQPASAVSIPTISSNTPVCAGGTLNFTSSAVGGTGTLSYSWTGPNSFSSGVQYPSINNVTTAATGTYNLEATDGNGCTASTTTAVTVNALPATPTITASGSTTFCSGGSVTLTSSTGSSYLWSTGATTQSINVTASGNYSVQVKNANGCQSAASTATAVTVNALPATPSITASGSTTFCSGGSVTLTSSTGSSYLWSTGATTQSINVTASGNYSVQVKNANGCQSAASTATAVTVNALPATPTITASGSTTFCSGGSVTLTSSTGSSYLWSTGATTQSINVTASGNYSVQVKNANGCQSAASTATAVTVGAIPSAYAGTSATILRGANVTLGTAPVPGNTYSWTSNPVGFTSATANPTVSPVVNTTYYLTETSPIGCTKSNSVTLTVTDQLSITKAITKVPVNPGDQIVYQINYKNENPNTGANNVIVEDLLPSGNLFTYISSTGSGVFDNATRKITWIIPSIAAGASGSFTVTGIAGSLGSNFYPLGASFPSYDPSSYYMGIGGGLYTIGNNASISNPSVGTINIANPINTTINQYCGSTLNPTTTTGYVKQNSWQDIYYLFTITNTGNITDSFSLSVGTPGTGDLEMGNGEIQSLFGATITGTPWLAPNASYTFLVRLRSTNGIKKGNENNTTLTATSFVCNSTSTSTITTIAGDAPSSNPDLKITKTASTTTATVGSSFQYTLTISNSSPQYPAVAGFTAADTIPASLTYISSSSSSSNATVSNSPGPDGTTIINVTQGTSLVNGSPVTITLTVIPTCTAVPTVKNRAWVQPTNSSNGNGNGNGNGNNKVTGDANLTDNVDSVTINVISNITAPTATSPTICINSTATLTATGAGTGYGYKWYDAATGGSPLSTDNPYITPSLTVDKTYYVEIYDQSVGSVCASSRTSVAVTVAPTPAIATQPVNKNECIGNNATFSVDNNASFSYQWQYSPDGGTNWYNLLNEGFYSNVKSSTLNVNGVDLSINNYQYRCVVSSGPCTAAISSPATLTVNNNYTWLGVNANWNSSVNWCPAIPGLTNDVTIPVLGTGRFYPVVDATSGTGQARNVTIASDATLTVSGETMQIAGNITNSGIGNIDATSGTIELNGPGGTQTVSGIWFKDKTIEDLVISNNVQVTATLNDTLNITGSISFNNPNASLNSGDNITLKSTATATASLGVVGSGNTVSGQFEIERYINIGTASGQHDKAWMFFATPTKGQTIYQSWMENGGTPTGYGTYIPNISGGGWDLGTTTYAPSIKRYDYLTDTWVSKPYGNTANLNASDLLYNPTGWMVFIRGDRHTTTSSQPTTNTTLRSKGTLLTGDTTYNIPVKDGGYYPIGNPYASAVDMRKFPDLTTGSGFYIWNPNLGGLYGLGAYQQFTYDGTNFTNTPGAPENVNNFILSGQAFLVPTDGSVITFHESSKGVTSTNATLFRGAKNTSGKAASLRTNLYTDDNQIMDGTLQFFSTDFSDGVDNLDAQKIFNGTINLALKVDNKSLIVERRQPVSDADTIFFNLTRTTNGSYYFQFDASDLAAPGSQAWLVDTYTKQLTPVSINGETKIPFSIDNNAASKAVNRFSIVFKTAAVLPVTFVSVNALYEGGQVNVKWTVAQEINLSKYVVMKSTDGNNFTDMADVAATGLSDYEATDKNPVNGYDYYRIRSVDRDGSMAYSNIVKVWVGSNKPSLSVFPNPVVNGVINLRFENMPNGKYLGRLLNPDGQLMLAHKFDVTGIQHNEKIPWNYKMAHGTYSLEVTLPDGSLRIIKVIY